LKKEKPTFSCKKNISIDERIAIPLFAIHNKKKIQLNSAFKSTNVKQLENIASITNVNEFSDEKLHHIFDYLDRMALIKDLPPTLKFSLIHGLAKANRTPGIYDWLSILHPIKFEFKSTRQYKFFIVILCLLFATAILGLTCTISIQKTKTLDTPSLPVIVIVAFISIFIPELTKAPGVTMTTMRWGIRILCAFFVA
jgi:hypothetical protein